MAYTLTVTISPAGSGSIQLSPMGDYLSPGKVSYQAGTVVTLTAYPALSLGYFDHWEGAVSGTSKTVILTMDSNKSVIAFFGALSPTYSLTTSVSGDGSVAPSEGVYDPGSQIILAASPGTGSQFKLWGGDTEGTSVVLGRPDHLSVTMDRDRHIIAQFEEIPETEPEPEHWHKIGSALKLMIKTTTAEPEHWHKIGTPLKIMLKATITKPHWHKIGEPVRLGIAVYIPPGYVPPEEEEEEKKFPYWAPILIGGGVAAIVLASKVERKK